MTFSGPRSCVEPLEFERAYAQSFEFVWRSVRGLGIPQAAVDDVAQDVFVIVHRKLDSLSSAAALRSWLFGIVRRVCRDHQRSTARRGQQLELDAEHECAYGRDPQERIASRQALGRVEAYAESLDDERRALFFLVLVEGLSITETAEALGMNANTTYSRVRVMRRELAEALEGAGVEMERGRDD